MKLTEVAPEDSCPGQTISWCLGSVKHVCQAGPQGDTHSPGETQLSTGAQRGPQKDAPSSSDPCKGRTTIGGDISSHHLMFVAQLHSSQQGLNSLCALDIDPLQLEP